MRAIYVAGDGQDFILSENGGVRTVDKQRMNDFMYAGMLEENPAEWPKESEWRAEDLKAAVRSFGDPLAYLTNDLDFVAMDFERYRERMRYYTKQSKGG